MSSDATEHLPHIPMVELAEIDSTNAEALRRASAGETGPLWLLARRQTAGRGRSGRAWQSLDGNLAATLLLRPGCLPDRLHQLSLLAGVAVHDAIAPLHRRVTVPGIGSLRLKWPNDLLAGEAKLAGILIESTTMDGQSVAAIGVGVNVAKAPSVDNRATAAIAKWQVDMTPRALLVSIDTELRRWLHVWQCGARFDIVRTAWLERAGPVGEPITVVAGAEKVIGTYAGIDETGALLVRDAATNWKETRRLSYGDVSVQGDRASAGDKAT